MSFAKLDPNLQKQIRAAASPDEVSVIVRHKTGVLFGQAIGGAVHTFKLLNASAMRLTAADIDVLSKLDDIEYIWADLPVHTCLDVSVPKLGVPTVWNQGRRGSGLKLGIVDTGIDPNHADFAGRIMARKNFAGGAEDDENGHGTHVAGIAAGNGATSNGRYVGVAPQAELHIAKVLDRYGNGLMSNVMAGIEWAIDQGVQVINLSLGGSGSCDGTDALSTLCDAAVTQAGVVMCVAAGNDGPSASTVGSPGCARQVITIGATDDDDHVTNFSSRGPTADGRVKPDVCFPGEGIVSAQAAGTQLGPVVSPGYISLDGTSMATPHASGSACLLLQANPALTPAQVKSIFQDAAIDLFLPANTQGTGRVDVAQAVSLATGTPVPPTPPPPTPTPPPPTPTPTPPGENDGCFPKSLAKLFKR